MKRPHAYLRRSRVFADQAMVSPEMQLTAAQEYAAGFGDADLVVLSDMNISGRKGRGKRPGFDALLAAIESGEVSAVYSYNLSRLSRSVRDLMELADLCRAHGVPIRLARDIDPDPTTATGRALLAILGVMAQMEQELAQERALDAVAVRRARGDKFGPPDYPHPEKVIDAYLAAGSATGASKILNAAGVPTSKGRGFWHPSSVRFIVERNAPHLLPVTRSRGVKHAAPFTFFRLVRCHCGRTMTGWRRISGPQTGYVSYRCTRGRLVPGHGSTLVAETRLMAWAMNEMRRLRPPTDMVAMAESTETEQDEIRARRDRLARAFVEGLIDETAMMVEKAELEDRLMRLDLQGRALRVPTFDWDHEPVDLNRALRALWEYVELDQQMQPRRAAWLVPSGWLRAPAAPESLAARPD